MPKNNPKFSYLYLAALLAMGLGLSGCEERERQDRQYRSDPAELTVALGNASNRAEVFEVLDLIAATDDFEPDDYPALRAALHQILEGEDPLLASKAGDVLARWGDRKASPALVALLRHQDRWVRTSAGASLAILEDPTVVAQVAEATLDPDENVRAQACRTIGDIGAPLSGRAHQLVASRLEDPFPSVQAAAAWALGKSGNADDLPALRRTAGTRHTGVAAAALNALGELHDEAAIPLLVQQLKADEQARIVAAASALGRIRNKVAVDPLLETIQLPDTIARGEAARALRRIGEPRAIPALMDLALDDDPLIATYVPFVVGLIYDPAYRDFLLQQVKSEHEEKRSAGIFALAIAQDDHGIEAARPLLSDPHHTVRISSASSLALLEDRPSLEGLRRLADYDPHPQVRDATRVAVEVVQLQGPTLVDRMILGLQHPMPEVRLNSTTMLTSLGAKRAIPALQTVLEDEEELIRNAARSGIKQLREE